MSGYRERKSVGMSRSKEVHGRFQHIKGPSSHPYHKGSESTLRQVHSRHEQQFLWSSLFSKFHEPLCLLRKHLKHTFSIQESHAPCYYLYIKPRCICRNCPKRRQTDTEIYWEFVRNTRHEEQDQASFQQVISKR
jgi:hypothetical protein